MSNNYSETAVPAQSTKSNSRRTGTAYVQVINVQGILLWKKEALVTPSVVGSNGFKLNDVSTYQANEASDERRSCENERTRY